VSRRVTLLVPLAVLTALVFLSCFNDAAGPRLPLAGRFALTPHLASPHAAIVPIDRFRLLLRRSSNNAVALDTVVGTEPDDSIVDLSFTVPMLTSTESFLLFLRLISPAGDTVFVAGPDTVAPAAGSGQPPAVTVELDYVGVGANAAGVRFLSVAPSVFSGDTVEVVAEAFDSAEAAIPGTPIAYTSLDTLRARVPDAGVGRVVGRSGRGLAPVVAALLTGPADTLGVLVQPVPVRVSIDSGSGQSALVGTALANPIVALVKAADSLGVAGVAVRFALPSGAGTLTADSGVTDASGRTSVGWTLGTTPGVYALTAKVTGIPDSLATATATATSPAATKLSFTVQPPNALAGAILTPGVIVTALDPFDSVDVNFTGTVTIALDANPGPGTLFGTLSKAATGGSVAFQDLMIDSVGSGYTLVATSGALASATSAAFDVTTPAPATVFWVNAAGGTWNNPANWVADPGGTPVSRVPTVGDTVFVTQPGNYTVTLDVDAHVAFLFVGGGGPTDIQTLAIGGPTLTHDSLAEFLGGEGGAGGVLALSGGTIASADTIAIVGGAFNWTGGTLTGGGALLGYGTLSLGGGPKTLDNYEVVNLSSATWSAGNITASSGGRFRNEAGATLSVTGNVTFAGGGGTPAPAFENQGILDVQGATLSVSTGFTHDAFAVLQGTGTLDIASATPVTFDGDVNPGTSPGILAITGPFPQGAGSTLNVELSGPLPGSGHDQLNVSGAATPDGALTLTTGYTPTLGDNLLMLSFGSRTGQFASVTGLDDLYPTTGTAIAWDTAWTSNGLYVKADGQITFSSDSAGGLPPSSGLIRTNASTTFRENVTDEGRFYDAYPRWSPDRRRLTHTANNLLHIIDAAPSSVPYHLVNDTLARRARYSPDGVHLAFECGGLSAGFQDVCTIADVTTPANGMGDGSGKVFVTDAADSRFGGPPAFAWNPRDPSQLAVVRDVSVQGSFTSVIYLVNFNGSGVSVVDTLPVGRRVVETMDWSPDGSLLAFGVANDSAFGEQQIWTLTVPGGVLDTVTAPINGAVDLQPVFSPDGTEILLQRRLPGCTDSGRYVITSASTGVERVEIPTTVYCEGETDAGHDWSPDGTQIVLVDGSLSDANKVYVVPSTVTAASYLKDRLLVGWPSGSLNASSRNPSWRP
jgi:Tol biopolymer transport system component